jgi:hypothetical protein
MLGNLGFRFERVAGVGWNWRRGTRVLLSNRKPKFPNIKAQDYKPYSEEQKVVLAKEYSEARARGGSTGEAA